MKFQLMKFDFFTSAHCTTSLIVTHEALIKLFRDAAPSNM